LHALLRDKKGILSMAEHFLKILITDGMASDGLSILKSEKSFDLDVRKATEAEELLNIISQYDCLVVRSATKVTKEVLEKGKQLKLICRAGAGVDNIDMSAAKALKIPVMSTASANSLAAAEHAIALMFAMFRQIPHAHKTLQDGKWDRASFMGTEVTGKTLGILGLGNIGKLVAERALGLKMNVVGFDPLVKSDSSLPIFLRGHVKVENSVDAVLRQADVLTIHLPITPETKNFLNRDRLGFLKEGAWIINCARGGLVDESVVCELLDSGKIRGVAFDVFEKEPVAHPHCLVTHPKAIVTPHLGASTHEAQNRVGITAAQQITDFFIRGEQTGVLN